MEQEAVTVKVALETPRCTRCRSHAISVETLEVGLNVLFKNYAMARYGPNRIMYLNNPMGAKEWNVMVCSTIRGYSGCGLF